MHKLIAGIAMTAIILSAWPAAGEPLLTVQPDEVTRVRGALTEFTVRIYSATDKGSGNFFFSPFSINESLAPLYNGARGHTATELAKIMQTDLKQTEHQCTLAKLRQRINSVARRCRINFSIARLITLRQGFPLKKSFITTTKKLYGSQVMQLDFARNQTESIKTINRWGSEHTNGRITDFASARSINPETTLALFNAIYFKAAWSSPFQKKETSQRSHPIYGTGCKSCGVTLYFKGLAKFQPISPMPSAA